MGFRYRGSRIPTDVSKDDIDSSFRYRKHPFFRARNRYFYMSFASDKLGIYIIEFIALLILLFAFFIYAVLYKPTLVDPIQTIKSAYMISMFIAMSISLSLMLISGCVSKSKETLLLFLKIVLALSIMAILIFIIVRCSLDSTYNEAKFAEIYSEMDFSEEDTSKKHVSIGITGVKLSEHKELFIAENVKAYSYFKLKTFLGMTLYVVIAGFDFYLISCLIRIQKQREDMNRDDNILFDEEENVKI